MTTFSTSQNRLRWKHAALCSLVVMLASLTALFGSRHFTTRATTKTSAVTSSTDADEGVIRLLSNKIVADNQRQLALQADEEKLSEEIRKAPAPSAAPSPTERVQHELTESFGDLLILQNQGEADSMEELEVRAKIDGLQALYATLPLTSGQKQTQVSTKSLVLQKQLDETKDQISQNEAQTKADVQRLSQLTRAKEMPVTPNVAHPVLGLWSIFFTSFVLALISGAAVYMSSGFVTTIVGDETFLRELLPSDVEVAGSVRHMRSL